MPNVAAILLPPSTRALQPNGALVPPGSVYCVTDEGNILEYWNGTAWVAYSPTGSGGGTVLTGTVNGRLTLESGVPISTADQTAKTTIYFTPFGGNQVALYDGASAWVLFSFTERSLALGTLTDAKNYDVFLYDSGGTPTLELSAAWTNDTTRADALVLQDGVWVKSGATTRRYLGTFRTTSTTTTEDSGGGTTTQVGGKRFVWNAYNRVERPMAVIDTTDSWSYGTATWRQANGASGNKVEYVVGLAEAAVQMTLVSNVQLTSNASAAGNSIGLDSTTANGTHPQAQYFQQSATAENLLGVSTRLYLSALGYHYLAWLEKGGGGTTLFMGDNSASTQSGMTGFVKG
jgi:hypothetical protein